MEIRAQLVIKFTRDCVRKKHPCCLYLSEKLPFLKNYITEGAVSTMFYITPLPITRYQVRFYANNYFEQLPIVSSAFTTQVVVSSRSKDYTVDGDETPGGKLSLFPLRCVSAHSSYYNSSSHNIISDLENLMQSQQPSNWIKTPGRKNLWYLRVFCDHLDFLKIV